LLSLTLKGESSMGNQNCNRYLFRLLLAAGGIIIGAPACFGQVRILVDQVGYETLAGKQAFVEGSDQDHPQKFALIDADSENCL